MSEIKKYRPSNGSDGEWFCGNFCDNCYHNNPDWEKEPHCQILIKTMAYSVKDPNYPSEWQYNSEGKPVCTKFKKWNWDQDGNPHDPNHPAYIMPNNPNQLKLF